MEFNEFRDDIYTKWQKKLHTLMWGGAITVFVFEMLIFIAFYKTNFLTLMVSKYLLIRVITPSTINFLAAIACTYVLRSNRFTVVQKNNAASLCILVLGSIVTIFHNYYKFLLVAEGCPIIISAVFADKALLRRVYRLCLVGFFLALLTMWFDDMKMGVVDYTCTSACAFIFLFVVYKVAVSIVGYQAEQINFIWSASQRQVELINELKIEPLTKLYNRTALNDALRSFVRKFNEGEYIPHLVLIDLDHFKKVNDTYGHVNGDEVLIQLALTIKENMGGIRRAFRYGGEEFVLLFENESTEEVVKIVEKISNDFSSHQFDFAPEEKLTFSAGVSIIQQNWDDTTWFSSADAAMYKAKEGGRNRTEVAEL